MRHDLAIAFEIRGHGGESVEITVETRAEGVAVVALVGRLDLLSAAEVKQRLASIVGEGNRRLIVDLDQVSFVDSSGLGALIGGLKAARQAGGDLRIARPPEQARVILDLTTLNRVLKP